MRTTRRLTTAVLAAALFLGACGGDDGDGGGADAPPPGPPADATIKMDPTKFDPNEVTIAPGETVRWVWAGGVQHNVVGEGFKSKLQTKGTFEHTFDTAGTYNIVCEVHPTTMKGTVLVE